MSVKNETVQSYIDACVSCAIECEHCATECLKNPGNLVPTRCIEVTRQCGAVCRGASELMAIGGEYPSLLFEACSTICQVCAEECEKYHAEHFQHCAAECRVCVEESKMMIAEVA